MTHEYMTALVPQPDLERSNKYSLATDLDLQVIKLVDTLQFNDVFLSFDL